MKSCGVVLNIKYKGALISIKAFLGGDAVCEWVGGQDGINMHEPQK